MTVRVTQRFIATVLSLQLAACSATHSTVPPHTEMRARRVLVIREHPSGEVTHAWQRAEDFNLAHSFYRPSTEGQAGRIVRTAGEPPDCYAQYLECYYQCRKAPLPPEFEHYLYDFGPVAGHERYCSERCMRQYTDCVKAQGARPQEFTSVDSAADWLKRHRRSVLAGTLVVIAGAVFVVVSAGAGLVVLAPVVLMTSTGSPAAAHLSEVSP
jgi:hypothetical protein